MVVNSGFQKVIIRCISINKILTVHTLRVHNGTFCNRILADE